MWRMWKDFQQNGRFSQTCEQIPWRNCRARMWWLQENFFSKMVPEGPERLFWHVLSISIVTTSSFNPVVSIKTMFHFVATMSFQEFHFPFHNDRRSWRQHFLSMNRVGKADWFNDDLPFLLQGLGPSFCCIHQYWSLKILLVFVFQDGDFGGGVHNH